MKAGKTVEKLVEKKAGWMVEMKVGKLADKMVEKKAGLTADLTAE